MSFRRRMILLAADLHVIGYCDRGNDQDYGNHDKQLD